MSGNPSKQRTPSSGSLLTETARDSDSNGSARDGIPVANDESITEGKKSPKRPNCKASYGKSYPALK